MVCPDKKPFAAVLNRNKVGIPMVILGPNRIFYDALNGDEFKILIPSGYNNMP